jgi:hypothetical protein
MVWFGLVLVLAGSVSAFALDGHAFVAAGAAAMAVGAVLLIAGILRLRRAARREGPAAVRQYRTSTGKIVAMIAAVVYIVSPIDLVPDPLLPVGIVDDATALAWLLYAFGQERHRRRVSRG